MRKMVLFGLALLMLAAPLMAGTLVGTVKTPTGTAIPGATVRFTPANYTGYADINGNYSIASAAVGTYTVTAGATGYSFQGATIVIASRTSVATQAFVLGALAPYDPNGGPRPTGGSDVAQTFINATVTGMLASSGTLALTGTMTTASTLRIANLNADLLDGLHASSFAAGADATKYAQATQGTLAVVSPKLWGSSGTTSTLYVATFYPTSTGLAGGTALFSHIYSINVTPVYAAANAGEYAFGTITSVAGDKRTITCSVGTGATYGADPTIKDAPAGTLVYITILGD